MQLHFSSTRDIFWSQKFIKHSQFSWSKDLASKRYCSDQLLSPHTSRTFVRHISTQELKICHPNNCNYLLGLCWVTINEWMKAKRVKISS